MPGTKDQDCSSNSKFQKTKVLLHVNDISFGVAVNYGHFDWPINSWSLLVVIVVTPWVNRKQLFPTLTADVFWRYVNQRPYSFRYCFSWLNIYWIDISAVCEYNLLVDLLYYSTPLPYFLKALFIKEFG